MNKILSITMLIMIGGAMTIALIVAWLMGMLYLLINEIIGTKKFAVKFRKINTIIAEEFKDNIRGIRSIFVESK